MQEDSSNREWRKWRERMKTRRTYIEKKENGRRRQGSIHVVSEFCTLHSFLFFLNLAIFFSQCSFLLYLSFLPTSTQSTIIVKRILLERKWNRWSSWKRIHFVRAKGIVSEEEGSSSVLEGEKRKRKERRKEKMENKRVVLRRREQNCIKFTIDSLSVPSLFLTEKRWDGQNEKEGNRRPRERERELDV